MWSDTLTKHILVYFHVLHHAVEPCELRCEGLPASITATNNICFLKGFHTVKLSPNVPAVFVSPQADYKSQCRDKMEPQIVFHHKAAELLQRLSNSH